MQEAAGAAGVTGANCGRVQHLIAADTMVGKGQVRVTAVAGLGCVSVAATECKCEGRRAAKTAAAAAAAAAAHKKRPPEQQPPEQQPRTSSARPGLTLALTPTSAFAQQ